MAGERQANALVMAYAVNAPGKLDKLLGDLGAPRRKATEGEVGAKWWVKGGSASAGGQAAGPAGSE